VGAVSDATQPADFTAPIHCECILYGRLGLASASLAALQKHVQAGGGRNRRTAAHVGGSEEHVQALPGEDAMTVAELIEKLSALPDKTARVVKSAGPWDGLNEPGLIYDGYVDQDMQFPVQATDPNAIHVVYL